MLIPGRKVIRKEIKNVAEKKLEYSGFYKRILINYLEFCNKKRITADNH